MDLLASLKKNSNFVNEIMRNAFVNNHNKLN